MSVKRALGCLYGQLIGDAFGCRYEFMKANATVAKMHEDSDSNGFIPILGGGPFKLSPGQVTDDSEMALSLAASLCRRKCFDPADVATAYVEWGRSSPPDIGNATLSALTVVNFPKNGSVLTISPEEKQTILKQVLENVKAHNFQSQSNGCLMRISPLAIAASRFSLEKVKTIIEADCHLTHCNDVCIDATITYAVAVGKLITEQSPEEAYSCAMEVCRTNDIRNILISAAERAIPVKIRERLSSGDGSGMGYLGVAMQSAFYELLHARTFAEGVMAAVRRGGDTDTNGAIVAALLGARFGIDGIPPAWIETIRAAKPRASGLPVSYDVEAIVPQLLNISDEFEGIPNQWL